MRSPVVKLLNKHSGILTPVERNHKIHPDWYDGIPEMDEKDVGWMYMCIDEYIDSYEKCEWAYLATWFTFYVKPPVMDGYGLFVDKSELPGF
jgi:hypothetical protein